jgi:hypothetical protein
MRSAPRLAASLFAVMLASLAAASSNAQATDQARAAVSSCTYDRCAFRIEGIDIVQGMEGRRVGRIWPFGVPAMTQFVAGSDSAVKYARIFERDYPRGTAIGLVGAVMTGAALQGMFDDFPPSKVHEEWVAAFAVGLGAGIWGGILEGRARRALSKSIWWYNRDLPR